jgi:hypothetical protein
MGPWGFGKGSVYRALRIALGLMGSTPNNCLGVLGGISPFAERFAYLNFGCFVAAFYRLGQPLAWSAGGAEYEPLHQRIFQCFIIGYSYIRVLHAA